VGPRVQRLRSTHFSTMIVVTCGTLEHLEIWMISWVESVEVGVLRAKHLNWSYLTGVWVPAVDSCLTGKLGTWVQAKRISHSFACLSCYSKVRIHHLRIFLFAGRLLSERAVALAIAV
jgi:hypothetical protein